MSRLRRQRVWMWPFGVCLVLVVICCCLSACGGAKAGESSPHMVSAAIASGGDSTEAGQYVEARITFDAPVNVKGDVASDLTVQLDGAELDAKTVKMDVSADGDELVVTLRPSEKATGGTNTGIYFACYQGELSIAAKAADGSLPHLTDVSGKTACVMGGTFDAIIPSGVALSTVSSQVGDAATSQPASVTVQVDSTATLRCCTWIDIDGERVYIHNHEFARQTPDSCATEIALAVTSGFDGAYTASAQGAQVTISATDVVDGQTLACSVYEGVLS